MAKFKTAIKNVCIYYEIDARTPEEADSIAEGIFNDDVEAGEFVGHLEIDPELPLELESLEMEEESE